MKDIHNNLPPIQIPFFTLWDWLIIAFLIFFFIWLYWKFFKPERGQETETKKEKAFKVKKFSFKKKIKELEKLLKKSDWKKFSLKSTSVLKLLLEKKYQRYFLFATGSELLELLKNEGADEKLINEVREFFKILDPIKFDQKKISKEEAEKVIKILEEINQK